jgi:predicted nucleotide kinase in modified base biosynthesis
MRELTRDALRVPRQDFRLVPYDDLIVSGEVVGAELGRRRLRFPGTDAMAYSALPAVRNWLNSHFYELVLGEGDRLTHIQFLDAAAEAGYEVNLLVLQARASVLDERCAARGSNQDRRWRNGRVTMCTRVSAAAEQAGYNVWHLDAEKPVADLAREALEHIPALHALRG